MTVIYFRVIARNKVGESLPSVHSKVCLTPEDVPYKNPDNVEGRGTKSNNLVIYWTVSRINTSLTQTVENIHIQLVKYSMINGLKPPIPFTIIADA